MSALFIHILLPIIKNYYSLSIEYIVTLLNINLIINISDTISVDYFRPVKFSVHFLIFNKSLRIIKYILGLRVVTRSL